MASWGSGWWGDGGAGAGDGAGGGGAGAGDGGAGGGAGGGAWGGAGDGGAWGGAGDGGAWGGAGGGGGGWNNPAHSQGKGKGKDKGKDKGKEKGKGKRRQVEHTTPLDYGRPAAPPAHQMNLAQHFIRSAAQNAQLGEMQLITQLADGERNSNPQWWDGPPGLQVAVRQAIRDGVYQFTHDHEYGSQPQRTRYAMDLEEMTSTNPTSGTVRNVRVVAVVMWHD